MGIGHYIQTPEEATIQQMGFIHYITTPEEAKIQQRGLLRGGIQILVRLIKHQVIPFISDTTPEHLHQEIQTK